MTWYTSITYDMWIEIIRSVSLLSTAGFGLLGLLTEFKKKGKITFPGRIAAVGVILSALLSIVLGTLQYWSKVEGVRAADEAREKLDRNLAGQLSELGRVRSRIERANDVSAEALLGIFDSQKQQSLLFEAQQKLVDSTQQSLLLTAGLSRQERQSTDSVLRSLWYDANRIRGDRLELIVNHECRASQNVPAPNWLSGGEAYLEFTGFKGGDQLTVNSGQEVSYKTKSYWSNGSYHYTTVFRSFAGSHMDRFSDPSLWQKARVGVRVYSPSLITKDATEEIVGDLSPIHDEFKLPCNDSYSLYVNGRLASSYQFETRLKPVPNEADLMQVYLLSFSVPFHPNAVPSYGDTTGGGNLRRHEERTDP